MASNYDGRATKRQRTDANGFGVHQESFDDPHKTAESPVVHVRGLAETVVEADLIEAVQPFGNVGDVFMMPRKRQALVEFEDISGATNLINYAQSNPIYICGKPTHFNYSTSQKIQRPGGDDRGGSNNVLLFTIINPQYPITVHVMHTICSPSGTVNRIVIFKKNGVQAMVEFEDAESARKAKQSLNGADVYSGCCTLKIEYARPTRLNVVKNDNESWDYTNPNLGKESYAGAKGQPLLADPRYGAAPTPYDGQHRPAQGPPPPGGYGAGSSMEMDYGQGEMYDAYGRPEKDWTIQPHSNQPVLRPAIVSKLIRHVCCLWVEGKDQYGGPRHEPYGSAPRGYGPPDMGALHSAPPGMIQQGSVLMVYGLTMDNINCTKIFNLFCLYGNVVRVKFLRSKEGSAMIQMGDNVSCDRALKMLNGCFFYESKMQLGFSKQAFLQDVPNPHDLPDGTPSFVDFMGNRNNRFSNPEAAAKNRIQMPSKSVYYFNAPPGMTDDQLQQVHPPRMFTTTPLSSFTEMDSFKNKLGEVMNM
ncbi:Heterogeneous nuclear ribonucleoprotein L [Lamellibrachia satsuma]|nr:Heterogeneous nuclear ribonucleoprotein L [Lamellibrachia satsuma]